MPVSSVRRRSEAGTQHWHSQWRPLRPSAPGRARRVLRDVTVLPAFSEACGVALGSAEWHARSGRVFATGYLRGAILRRSGRVLAESPPSSYDNPHQRSRVIHAATRVVVFVCWSIDSDAPWSAEYF